MVVLTLQKRVGKVVQYIRVGEGRERVQSGVLWVCRIIEKCIQMRGCSRFSALHTMIAE